MPTHDPHLALDRDALHEVLDAATRGRPGATGLGVEIELFPIISDPSLRRVALHGTAGLLTQLAAAPEVRSAMASGEHIREQGWWSGGDDGFRSSFEPGGQIEVSSCYREQPAAALDVTRAATSMLATALGRQGISLAAAGLDVWAPGTATQQLRTPRYTVMDRYLAARSPDGRTMMRDTCALQLNLDLDEGAEAQARWLVANLLAPVATASFASSPSPDGSLASRRSLAWQRLDRTRTGFPRALSDPNVGLVQQLEQLVLEAEVLTVPRPGGGVVAGPRGWSFGTWLTDGDNVVGWPTRSDLDTHLTTLFPEVRMRGYLEVRSLDALPARWRGVAAVLYVGALYDPDARDRILEVLHGRSAPLSEQLRQAATTGVADPAWCATAVEVWSYALEGAGRQAPEVIRPADLTRAERFLDRFTLRGRAPADELAETLRRQGPAAALQWAAEPQLDHDATPKSPARG